MMGITMRAYYQQNYSIKSQLSSVLLAVLLTVVCTCSEARGLRGGGQAGALGDFDLFLQTDTTNGLPVNLVNGLEHANAAAGDATVGVGGTFGFDPNQQTVNSRDGSAITLLPSIVNGENAPRAGFARKLGPDGLPPMLSLKTVSTPSVPELAKFIRNKQAAILLGKALFWDVQAGSDGNACASCHFHAGADNRFKNQLSPGLKANDNTFQAVADGAGGANFKLKSNDFPFHQLTNPLDRNSALKFETNDVVSSQGAFGGEFQHLNANGKETCAARANAESFNVNSVMTRRVPPRNTPSTINAVFNYRNFWDGRANNRFNGVSPFGSRDTNATVLELLPDGTTVPTKIAIENASLASQAVGPILSDFEMSCANRTFKDVARKLLALQPLKLQKIHAQDSVMGAHTTSENRGLKETYPELIKAAFEPRWWSSTEDFNGYSQMESNFSLYWGLAIMMYESTLVSDETPFDKLIGDAGHAPDLKALTAGQLRGLAVFRGKGQCLSCHRGAEFTAAATSLQRESGDESVIESMLLKTGQLAVYDSGFYNIGVRPAAEDRGAGDNDPFGNSLTFTRNWFDQLRQRTVADPVWVDPCKFSIFFDATACWIAPNPDNTRVVSDGTFKTPTLRNIALTQPYFHTGGYLTLEQVVEFYNRGGNRRGADDNDSTGFVAADSPNGGTTNVHPNIKPLGLTAGESKDLVDFLRNALTDQRVACESAPFDHPSLKLHDGHKGDEKQVQDRDNDGMADDKYEVLPAVGRNGLKNEKCLTNDDGSVLASLRVMTPPTGTGGGTGVGVITPPTSTSSTGGTGATSNSGNTGSGGNTGSNSPSRSENRFTGSLNFGQQIGGDNSRGTESKNNNSRSNDSNESNSRSNDFRDDSASNNNSANSNNTESGAIEIAFVSNDNSASSLAPAANVNAPETVLARSRVTIYGAVTKGATYVWTQIEGPVVQLSRADTLAPSFTAPAQTSTLVFELSASDPSGVSTTTTSTISVVTDNVTIHAVNWSKPKGKTVSNGRLNVVASSSAMTGDTLLPVGMGMTASFWSKSIREGELGSASKPFEAPMTLAKNEPGKPAVCANALPCFNLDISEIIVDDNYKAANSKNANIKNKEANKTQNLPLIVSPTNVVVKSFLGGVKTVKEETIRVR
jgi:cytochrome c peroxidase